MDLRRLRGRMPLIAFVLLAVVCLALLGFVCACLATHPAQAIDRALSVGAGLPALVDVWVLLVALAAGPALVVGRVSACGRASPALTQRFRF